jgi:hypothetical protein
MEEDANVNALDRRYEIVSVPANEIEEEVTYQLLALHPDRIEHWVKRQPTIDTNMTLLLSVTSVNGEYVEKTVTFKWAPDMRLLIREKIGGRGRVSFKHVRKHRFEIKLAFYGEVLVAKMIHVTDVTAAKREVPILMRPDVQSDLDDWIPLDPTYTEEEMVEGYEAGKPTNLRLQLVMEEEMEGMLDNSQFTFTDDTNCDDVLCEQCENLPCVWADNQQAMVAFDQAENDEDAEPNKRRHGLYRQMALIINGGPSGSGNRLKLPTCVLTGVRELFPDPEAVYTGHKERE